jgi:uncharacterized protein (TIGR03663 family)
MTRAAMLALVAIAAAGGLALRLDRIEVRPMHHDEANQALKFGALLERGEYRYDARDHHGPTLYYLTLPAAWLRGQRTFASLDETTLRGVTAVFGAATILLVPMLSRGIGRTPVAAAAILMAVSPVLVFYSRMFIQESLFACFTLAFVIAIGRVLTGGGFGWSTFAGATAGLAAATKETSIIVLPAALVAAAIASGSLRSLHAPSPFAGTRMALVSVGLGSAVAVAALFYSSFLSTPAALFEPFRGARVYLNRGIDAASHAHPWDYYLRLLTYSSSGGVRWSEAFVLVLAGFGAAAAFVRPRSDRSNQSGPGSSAIRASNGPAPSPLVRTFWTRYLTATAVLTTAIFSALPYKTPWNLLPFYVTVVVLAGIGFSWLVHASSVRAVRIGVAAGFALGSAHLGWQAWRASVTYAADPRNPYVYAQTVPDAVRMATRIRELAALHQDGLRMQVSVIASPYEQWPLPWYLRSMPYVGYWTAPGDPVAMEAPVIVTSVDHTAALDRLLGDRYVSEFFGLRPEVVLALYVERGLWNRFLARTTTHAKPGARVPVGPRARQPRGAAMLLAVDTTAP